VGVFSLFGIYDFVVSKLFSTSNLLTISGLIHSLDWWIWLVIVLVFLLCINFRELYKLYLGKAQANWIELHQLRYGKLPILPDYLRPVAEDCPIDKPISKDMNIKIASGQYWHSLRPSQQEELLQLWEWTGRNRRDYFLQMEIMSSKTPKGVEHIKWRPSTQR